MDELEFQQAVGKTRLTDRTSDAVRRVLVGCERQVDVAEDTGILKQQLSRAVGVVEREWEKIREQMAGAHHMRLSQVDASRAEIIKNVRGMLGDQILVRNAPENGLCEGKVLLKNGYHLVQDLLKGQVMVHELAKMERVPKEGEVCRLRYVNGFAEVQLKQKAKVVDRGSR